MSRQKTAVVTGASRGIGAAIATRLASDGFCVIVNFAGREKAAADVVAAVEAAGGSAIAVKADIGAPDGMRVLFDAAEERFGGVDVLVNNAGVMELSPIAATDDERFERQIAVNLGGTFRGMREAANRLGDGGRIISFSSSVVGIYQPTYGVYAASKAAVEAMSRVLAKELGPRGISVNVVAPGPVETELFLDGKSEELVQRIAASNPFGRLGRTEDVAGVVSFLAGPDGGWINGQVIRVNGGMV